MPVNYINTNSAEHHNRRGDNDGSYLVRTSDLYLLEEHMSPGTGDTHYRHKPALQFFYVLEGELTVDIEGNKALLSAAEGIQIQAGQSHQLINRGAINTRFLVITQPPSHGSDH